MPHRLGVGMPLDFERERQLDSHAHPKPFGMPPRGAVGTNDAGSLFPEYALRAADSRLPSAFKPQRGTT
jgi:hypothetical protein